MGKHSDEVTTPKKAHAVIEELAQCYGTFTTKFRQKAEEEAQNGDRGKLQTIQRAEELQENFVAALKM